MSAATVCSTTLNGCGSLILLLFLLPQLSLHYSRSVNRHRQRLLNDAAVVHLFVLILRMTGSISALAKGASLVLDSYRVLSAGLWVLSAGFAILCICCDAEGTIHIPRGRAIPMGQIACAALPLALAACLQQLLPQIDCFGITWAAALHLNHSLILIDSEKQLVETEQRLDRTHAAQMAVQMQPHFIFNTLSAIQSLCLTDPQAAMESVENLSGYLRGNLDALSAENIIPFDTEMEHIRQYIALEQTDPSRQFHFDYELEVRNFSLPSLTVQPIVENAVKHGALTHQDGTGRVLLTTQKAGKYICITITDNGLDNSGLTQAQRDKIGIGIESTRKRLHVLCGGSLSISSDASGTKAVLLVPRKTGG